MSTRRDRLSVDTSFRRRRGAMSAAAFACRARATALVRRGALQGATALMDGASRALRLLPGQYRYLPADVVTYPLALYWERSRPIIARNFAALLSVESDRAPRAVKRGARVLARRSIRNFGRMAIDFLIVRTLSGPEARAWVTTFGEDYLVEELRRGHGAIFVLPHLGSWDVAAAFFGEAYGGLTVVTESDWAAELVAGSRAGRGVSMAQRGTSLRSLFRALARNECVALLGDIAKDGLQTVNVPFLGRPAPFPIGPARLAQHTGAPILVVSNVRMPDGSYRLDAQPPLRPDPTLPTGDAAIALTAAIARGFERASRSYPEHWYPFHVIWPADQGD